jgi:hypothetical protein
VFWWLGDAECYISRCMVILVVANEATSRFEQSLAVNQSLADADLANADSQHALSIS